MTAMVLAGLGVAVSAYGGWVLGRRSRRRHPDLAEGRLEQTLDRLLEHLNTQEDAVAAAVDPLVLLGRVGLERILDKVRELGGYSAVALSDDHGLVVAAVGERDLGEQLAVLAAGYGGVAERSGARHRALVEGRADEHWTVYRFFSVDGERLCISGIRQGATPRLDALDGAVGALARVLGSESLRAAG